MRGKIAKVLISMRPHINTHSELTQGILDYARLHGPWQTRIMGIDNEFSTRNFRFDDLDGAIVENRQPSKGLISQLKGIPIISALDEQLSMPLQNAMLVQIRCDNEAVANAAANFLLAKSPGDLAFVNAPGNPAWSRTRASAFDRRTAAAGRKCHLWFSARDSHRGSFPASFTTWLKRLPVGTALFAANDSVARHILNICLEQGLAVPERLSILGVDNNLLICETSTPMLSSVALTTREAGFNAAKLLERMMRGHVPEPGFELFYSVRTIVERDSTSDVRRFGNTFAERMRVLIADHLGAGLGKSLTVGTIATAAGISRRSAEIRFKNETGRTIHQEITRLRVKRAMDMITSGQETLDAIAEDYGFANASHLCRLFKDTYGKTPASFRTTPTVRSP